MKKRTTNDTLKENIKRLVAMEPDCAESYTKLTVRYWVVIEGALSLDEAVKCTSPETITRIFRGLVNSGDVTIPEDVNNYRKRKQIEMTKQFSPGRAETFTSLTSVQ